MAMRPQAGCSVVRRWFTIRGRLILATRTTASVSRPAATGIRIVDVRAGFHVWAWDPVEGATGHQRHALPDGTPVWERPPLQGTVEPTFRADRLEPGTVMVFFVHVIRETARACGRPVVGSDNRGDLATSVPSDDRDRDGAGQRRAGFLLWRARWCGPGTHRGGSRAAPNPHRPAMPPRPNAYTLTANART